MLLVERYPSTFKTVAVKTNIRRVEWFKELEISLMNAEQLDTETLYQLLFAGTSGSIDGPTSIDVLERKAPKGFLQNMLSILVGEVHGNAGGCAKGVVTIFKLVTDAVVTSVNVFLILESFFHMIPRSVKDVEELSNEFETKSAGNRHSVWNACACIGSGVTPCEVDGKKIGQLILFRAFSFIIQVCVVYLNSVGVSRSVFHKLASRIFHMDLREDLGLRPYEWIEGGDKNVEIVDMLKKAKPMLTRFIPNLQSGDLRNSYENNVFKPLLKNIDECIKHPTQELYTTVFITITELVTLAVHFSIMEKYKYLNPQIMVVVGDSHRGLINDLLHQSLSGNVTTKARFTARTNSTSCTRV